MYKCIETKAFTIYQIAFMLVIKLHFYVRVCANENIFVQLEIQVASALHFTIKNLFSTTHQNKSNASH